MSAPLHVYCSGICPPLEKTLLVSVNLSAKGFWPGGASAVSAGDGKQITQHAITGIRKDLFINWIIPSLALPQKFNYKISMPTGQWSEPPTSLRMNASFTFGKDPRSTKK